MLDPGCKVDDNVKGETVYIEPAPYKITADIRDVAGFSFQICYKCWAGGFVFTKEPILVKQNIEGDCSAAIYDAGFVNPNEISYNPAGSSISITASYLTIFTHVSKAACPLSGCLLKELGCAAPLPAQLDVVLEPNPYGITAVETNVAGYSLTFCFECQISS